mgnify:FL=1
MDEKKQNNIESFSKKTIKAIKYYVYALVNPKTENIFYIGKGSKNRCFKSWKEQNQKKDFIPRVDIIRYGLSEEDALEVEAAVIDSIGVKNIDNEVRGHKIEKSRMVASDLNRQLGGEKLNVEGIKDNAILFFPHKALERGEDLYDSTRQYWAVSKGKISKKTDSGDLFYKYAFGMKNEYVLDVYEIIEWFPAGTTISSRTFYDDGKTRWEFIGKNISRKIEKLYKNKRLYERGNPLITSQRGIRYLEIKKSMK